jgi:hypothetical protein
MRAMPADSGGGQDRSAIAAGLAMDGPDKLQVEETSISDVYLVQIGQVRGRRELVQNGPK